MAVRFAAAALAVVLGAVPAAAQEGKEAIKKRILAKVEEYLKREEERILAEIEKVIDEELARGAAPGPARPGFLGVQLADLTDEQREELGLAEGEGVLVATVVEGQPAQKAGVREGDVLLKLNDQKVGRREAVVKAVRDAGAGATVTLRLLRGDEEKDLKVKLGEPARPEAAPPEQQPKKDPKEEAAREKLRGRIRAFLEKEGGPEPAFLGIRVAERPEEGGGVRIVEVREGSAAQKAGLRKDQVLLKVDGQAVGNERDLARLLQRVEAGAKVRLTVLDGAGEKSVEATVEARQGP
jgi:serine protease Do